MDIGQFYDIVQFIADKHQQGYLSPDQFNNSVNLAQNQLMEEIVQAIQGWDENKKRIRLPMGNAQQTIQKIAPFIMRGSNVTVASDGKLTKPAMANLLAIKMSDNMTPVVRVEHDRVTAYLSSTLDPVASNPIYTEYDTYYQVYPINIGAVNMDYIKNPAAVKWAYTLVSGRPVYDQPNSVQLLWGEGEVTEIMSRVLFMFGISIQAQNLVAYYQSVKNDGQ